MPVRARLPEQLPINQNIVSHFYCASLAARRGSDVTVRLVVADYFQPKNRRNDGKRVKFRRCLRLYCATAEGKSALLALVGRHAPQ